MLSSAKAESEEIIRNAKNKAEANTDSAQDTRDPKLSRVEAQCADTIKQCNRDVRIMFSSARAESEKIINSAKIEREEIIRNAKNEAETMIAELSQVNEKLSAAKAEREKIIQQGHEDARLILEKRQAEVDTQFSRLNLEISKKLELEKQLTIRIADLEKKIRKLERNINCITENKELIETVTPHQQLMEGPTSEAIKTSLNDIKEQQKRLIINGDAFNITDQILWNNSSAQGTAMQKRHGKFLITAFNAEVDNLIANTNLTNFSTNAKKIEKWFNKANKNGDDSCVEINRQLLHLRLEEQRYFFEHKYKKAMEIEEQRYVKDSLREEAKVKKEIELFVQAREKEEVTYLKDINEAMDAVKVANDETVNKLNAHIADLKAKLERATSEKERALSMAQLTRSGYVYIISNRGSFGENIYKIGMTRRLEPMDRVKELGDASVPFFFDVHALISSDDAPTLEKQLHNKFASRRVNKVNNRREFFKATFDEIEEALYELVEGEFNLVKDVISDQFEETQCLEQRELNNG